MFYRINDLNIGSSSILGLNHLDALLYFKLILLLKCKKSMFVKYPHINFIIWTIAILKAMFRSNPSYGMKKIKIIDPSDSHNVVYMSVFHRGPLRNMHRVTVFKGR